MLFISTAARTRKPLNAGVAPPINDKHQTPNQIYEEKTLNMTKRDEVFIGEWNPPKSRRGRSDTVTASLNKEAAADKLQGTSLDE